ncbi:uncharacterized protein SAPINGB_P004302 [Magnusiomyces paraingens]|uniref:Uncharacterized protein n=1 Tax=Magnusiomyces paraingens TaxID=2606893 RepID=A0A5E8BZ54_9ASCO|nr:uncharacterized protein SAPINGB_P004302 [Saprochaete ingens]VVT54867.1 unnamed protein product [Saprochaete ingens]
MLGNHDSTMTYIPTPGQFFVTKGIKHTYSRSSSPQQNGVAERLNRPYLKAKSIFLSLLLILMGSNTETGVLLGILWIITAYRVLLDSSIVEARSVYFDESKFPFMKSDKDLSINGTGVGFSVGSGSGSIFGSHRSLPASSSGSGSGSGSGSICALPSPSPSSSPSHSPSAPPSSSSSSIIVHKPRSVRRILSTPSAPLESPTLPSIPSVPSLPSSPILPPSDHDVSISPDSSPIVSPSEYIPSQLDLSEAGPSINESDISGDSGISQRGGDIGFQPSIIASSPIPPPSVELEVVPLSQESPSSDLVNSLDQAGNGQRDQFDDEQEIGRCPHRLALFFEWVSDVEWATELPVLADSKGWGSFIDSECFRD